jgi:dihydroxyacid dehydratase/phosphogluconate dehydratase
MEAKTNLKSRLPSRHVTEGPARAPHRSYYYVMGLTEEQIHQPFVGVASWWNEGAPCNIALMRQAQAVKKGVAAAGGTPREFCTVTVTDGIAIGHDGVRSSLTSREVIADSVEREALENAAAVVAASGGSTNAALHLRTIAHECGIAFDLFDVAEVFKRTPYIADLKPAGRFVAKDLFEAGGVPLLMKTLLDNGFMHGGCITVTGYGMAENLKRVAWNSDQEVVRPADRPLTATGGVVGAALRPRGRSSGGRNGQFAIEKRRAAWQPRGSAFESGYLWKYAQQVGSARHGAVTHPGGAAEKACYADI